MWVRAVAVVVAVATFAACSSADDVTTDDQAATTGAAPTTVTVPAAPTSASATTAPPTLGSVVVGAGSVTGLDPGAITATPVAPPPAVPGMLSIEPGVSLAAPSTFVGAFTIELPVGAEPAADAVPGVLHVLEDGSTEVLPGVWDADKGTITVWASHFSDFFGGWWNPLNWAEEVVQVAQGTFDAVADWATGRTDPPPCRNDAPAWASLATQELASVHVCVQSNPDPDTGIERVEVFIKSNRSTAQMITIPTGVDYAWVEDQPDFIRPVLSTVMEGYGGSQSVVLFGGKSMSLGFTRPFVSTDVPIRAYVPAIEGVLNQLFGLAGVVDGKDLVALTLAAYRCTAEVADFSILKADVIPQGFSDAAKTAMSCALDVLSDADLATSTAAELANSVGGQAGRDFVAQELAPTFKKLAPTAKKLARVLVLAQVTTNTFDAIFDQFAEGLATLTLTGTRSTGSTAPPTAPPGGDEDFCAAAPRSSEFIEQPVLRVHDGRADHVATIDVLGVEVYLVAVCDPAGAVALARVEPGADGYVVVREFATVADACSVADVGDFANFAAASCGDQPIGQECPPVEQVDDNGASADRIVGTGITCDEIDGVIAAVLEAEAGPNQGDRIEAGSLVCSIGHQPDEASLIELYTCVGDDQSVSWRVYYGE